MRRFNWTQDLWHPISRLTGYPVAHECLLWERQPAKDNWKSERFFPIIKCLS